MLRVHRFTAKCQTRRPKLPDAFFMFLNDINQCITADLDGILMVDDIKLFLLLYADDQVRFGKSPEALQAMLLDHENYCNIWGLKINTTKTKTMIF